MSISQESQLVDEEILSGQIAKTRCGKYIKQWLTIMHFLNIITIEIDSICIESISQVAPSVQEPQDCMPHKRSSTINKPRVRQAIELGDLKRRGGISCCDGWFTRYVFWYFSQVAQANQSPSPTVQQSLPMANWPQLRRAG
jgi:hypothetical protein